MKATIDDVRGALEKQAREKLDKALMHLVLYKPFFGSLILRLKVAQDTQGHPTLWCDGRALRYNAAFVFGAEFASLTAALAHLVGHCMLRHPYRRGNRDLKLWNDACDQAVNEILNADGDFGRLEPEPEPRFAGMSAEEIYSVLESEQSKKSDEDGGNQVPPPPAPEDAPQATSEQGGAPGSEQQEGSEQGKDDGEGSSAQPEAAPKEEPSQVEQAPGTEMGDVLDAGTSGESEVQSTESSEPSEKSKESEGKQREENSSAQASPSDAQASEQQEEGESQQAQYRDESQLKEEEEEWALAAASAAVQAEVEGSLSADASRKIRESLAPRGTYIDYLRMFLSSFAREDSDWSRPNRKTAATGPYLPSPRSEAVGKIVLVVDTSGSITEHTLASFEAEFSALHAELRPEEVIVLFADAWVKGEQRLMRYDQVSFDREQCRGGGGTRFGPAFEWVRSANERGENIKGLVYLTDLIGKFPEAQDIEPDLAVLWVATTKREAPFGEVCRIFS